MSDVSPKIMIVYEEIRLASKKNIKREETTFVMDPESLFKRKRTRIIMA